MIAPVLPTYNRAPVAFDHGKGVRLYTEAGEEYLDFGAGVAVTSLGHAHPHLVEALTTQAGKLWHTSNLYQIPGQEKLARRLIDNTFADTVFFTNSGAEALECSIKMARKYHAAKGNPERFRHHLRGAFHGRTLATIAAGGWANISKASGRRSRASTRSVRRLGGADDRPETAAS
jgi:acetylornithine/N-succinyldiaminopimelate aminotransferase